MAQLLTYFGHQKDDVKGIYIHHDVDENVTFKALKL